MLNQTIANAVVRHGGNLLKIGAVMIAGSIANQALKMITQDSILELIRDVKRAKAEFAERRQQAA